MNYYGFPPGYSPDPPSPIAIPANLLDQARRAGATHLSSDGRMAYCSRYQVFYEAEWGGIDFGVWWVSAYGLPAGAIEL